MKSKRKSRKQKEEIYNNRYGNIPLDYVERLSWLYDELHITDKKADEILRMREQLYNFLYYKVFKIILFEEPEGTPRPRFRLINRQNLCNHAMNNGAFVHVYSLNAKEDNNYMKRLVDEELYELQSIIYSPCDVEFNTFHRMPSYFNASQIILGEIGLIRPITKPDWDNIGKKYSDMFNNNVWVDDTCVISGAVNKFYSALPRIEINLKYLNGVYTKQQANSIENKINECVNYFNMKGR